MTILDQIITTKRQELEVQKQRVPLGQLLDQLPDNSRASFSESLRAPRLNVIAEIKFRSPSHGPFHCQDEPERIARSYVRHGAAALSVLTDHSYFGGELEFLDQVCRLMDRRWCLTDEEAETGEEEDWQNRVVPLLRKDFIIDHYQVAEAKLHGASAFLLIVSCLERRDLEALGNFGRELGLEALVEVHDERELDVAISAGSRVIGVNNRNLRNFEVDLQTSFRIARRLEGDRNVLLVAESGISERSQVLELRDAGFSGFLVGSRFMDAEDPGEELGTWLGEE